MQRSSKGTSLSGKGAKFVERKDALAPSLGVFFSDSKPEETRATSHDDTSEMLPIPRCVLSTAATPLRCAVCV